MLPDLHLAQVTHGCELPVILLVFECTAELDKRCFQPVTDNYALKWNCSKIKPAGRIDRTSTSSDSGPAETQLNIIKIGSGTARPSQC